MKHSTLPAKALWCAAISVVAISVFSTPRVAPPGFARAESACSFPACNRKREHWDRASGFCQSRSGFPSFAISHRSPTCLEGERFDPTTGNCVLSACDDGCEARAACPEGWRYGSYKTYRGVDYARCESGPSGLGHISHTPGYCPDGFTLNTARGVCVGNCKPPKPPLPDLVIRRVSLRISSGRVVTRIRAGQSYLACFEVVNIGAAESGPFDVGGGGLGVLSAPFQRHATLLPGASREGCLSYSTTPPAGSYLLGIDADSRNTVREMLEDNNGATLAVNVIP